MFGKILNLRLIKYSKKLKYYLKYGAPRLQAIAKQKGRALKLGYKGASKRDAAKFRSGLARGKYERGLAKRKFTKPNCT